MKLLRNKLSILAPLAGLSALALTGCGKQTFETISTRVEADAPGFIQIAPKVDIVLAQDNTGSMISIYDDIGAQMPGFLNELASSGWDYHFAAIPLTPRNLTQFGERQFSQVLASRQDRNWGESSWLAPYPGAVFGEADSGQVAASYFRRPESFTDYRTNLYPSTSLSGSEPGLENIRRQLSQHMGESNFHRPDALLVVIVVGNGNDTSGVKICRRYDGVEAPCETSGMGGTSTTVSHCGTPGLELSGSCSPGALNAGSPALTAGTFAYAREFYKQRLQALRPSASQVKLYAAVSTLGGNCYGSPSVAGTQYSALAGEMGGTSHNICSAGAASVLSSIRSSLQVTRMALRTVYLMLDREPEVSTIRVIRYVDGNRNRAVEIPQDDVNGWSFAGMITDQPRVVTDGPNPATMNTASGWAVRLNGSARLSGADTAEVRFQPRTTP
jgi:hypothetical protein